MNLQSKPTWRLRRQARVLAVAGLVLCSAVSALQANPSALQRPKVKEILRTQGWDSIDNWRNIQEQAENLVEWGLYADAERFYVAAEKLLERHKGKQHPYTLRNRADLANTRLRQGKQEGEKELREVYALQTQRLKTDHPDLLRTRHLLANVHIAKGDLPGAEKELRDVISRRARVLGPGHADTLASRSNLALILGAQLRSAEAEMELRLVLAAELQNLGPKDLQTCSTRERLGNCYQKQSMFAEALGEYREVLSVLQKEYGPRHPLTFRAQHQLARTLYEQGKHEEAEQDFRKMVQAVTELTGPESLETLGFRSGVAECLGARGKLAEAEKEWRELVDICQRTQGEASPEMQKVRSDLAGVLLELRKSEEAEKLLNLALEQRRKLLGNDHPVTLDSRLALVTCRAAHTPLPNVEIELRTLVATNERVQGMHHPATWLTRIHLAEILRQQHKFPEALSLYEGSLYYNEKTLGPMHPYTLKARNNVAITLAALGRDVDAYALQSQLLKEREQVMGRDHPDTIKSRLNIASHLLAAGRMKEAEEAYAGIYTDAARVLGGQHGLTLMALSALADLLCADRRAPDVERLVSPALRSLEPLEPEHGEVVRMKTVLAQSLLLQGKLDEAGPLVADLRKVCLARSGSPAPELFISKGVIAWWGVAAGQAKEAVEMSKGLVADCEYEQLGPENVLLLRSQCLYLLALHADGQREAGLNLATEIAPRLASVFGERSAITAVPGMLRGKARLSIPPLLLAVQYSMPRMTPQNDTPDLRALAREAAVPFQEADRLSLEGRHDAAYEGFNNVLAKYMSGAGRGTITAGELHLFLAREAVFLGKEQLARAHFRQLAKAGKNLPWRQSDFASKFAFELASRQARKFDFKIPITFGKLLSEEAATALGPKHGITVGVNAMLSSVLLDSRSPEAREFMLNQSKILEKEMGPNHASTLTMKLNLLRCYLTLQEFQPAHELAFALEEPVTREYGKGSAQHIIVKMALASALEGRGLRSMAVEESKSVLVDSESSSHPDAIITVMPRHSLALILERGNEAGEAILLHQKNLRILDGPVTGNDPLIVEVRLHLAWSLMVSRRFPEAMSEGKLALAASKKFFGPEHVFTQEIEKLLRDIVAQSALR